MGTVWLRVESPTHFFVFVFRFWRSYFFILFYFILFYFILFYFILFFKFIYLFWERERAREEEGRKRGEERASQAGSCAVSVEPNGGLELMNYDIMTWAETKSRTLNRLSHPGTPTSALSFFIFAEYFFKSQITCHFSYKYFSLHLWDIFKEWLSSHYVMMPNKIHNNSSISSNG